MEREEHKRRQNKWDIEYAEIQKIKNTHSNNNNNNNNKQDIDIESETKSLNNTRTPTTCSMCTTCKKPIKKC